MSAETTISNYLVEQSMNQDRPTIQLLESYVLTEGVSIKPLVVIGQIASRLKDLTGVSQFFGDNKVTIQKGVIKSATALEDVIFDDASERQDNPVKQPAPRTKQEAETYLKKLHKWLSAKIKIDFNTIKGLFNKALAFMTKAVIGLGIVGTVIASSSLTPFLIIMAIIIVYLCIVNAIEYSATSEKPLDFNAAFANIIDGFKRMFTTIKIEKGASKVAIIGSVLVGVFVYFRKYLTEKLATALRWMADETGNAIKHIKTFFGDKGISGMIKVIFQPDWLKKVNKKKDIKKVGKGVKTITDKFGNVIRNVSDKTFDYASQAAGFAKDVGDKMSDAILRKADKLDKGVKMPADWSEVISIFTFYIAIPLMLIMSVLYLFAELVDSFNLKKIKEEEAKDADFEGAI